MLIMIIVKLVIHSLYLTKWFDNCVKCENFTDRIQALERLTIDKIQALERPTYWNKKNTQTQTEEFRQEPIAPLHEETEEGWPTLIKKPTLVHPVTTQEWPADDGHPRGYAEVKWDPLPMLD